MRTRKYKTLKGLLSQTNQLNFNDFHANRFIHKKHGWMMFSLPDEEKDKGYTMLASAIYHNGASKISRMKRYSGKAFGILNRIFFERGGATYCAGQDYPAEIRTIQGIFRN